MSKRSLVVRGAAAVLGSAVLATAVYAALAGGSGQDVIEARGLILRDEQGRKRAELSERDGRVGLFLYDARGTRRASVATTGEWLGLVLYDSAGDETGRLVGDPAGSAVLDLSGNRNLERVELVMPERGTPTLRYYDENGGVAWAAPYTVAMRHGLYVVSVRQEHYFSERNTYARDASELELMLPQGVDARILEAGPGGWAAEATHGASPGRSCVMYGGTVVTIPATAGEGKRPPEQILPACDR